MQCEPRDTEIKYFAASNSARGFVNYFPECFGDNIGRLYIIKGGPGTGKSYFMRRAGWYAERHGYTVEYYYCSSDSTSLDGVRIQMDDECIGIIDGTAPHAAEPKSPGVREEIVNLGCFWNGEVLRKRGEEIKKLASGKSAAYARAYDYLAAAGKMNSVIDSLMTPCILEDKITSFAKRLVRDIPVGRGFHAEPALCRAIGMRGRATFDTFARLSDKVYVIENFYGTAGRVLKAILDASHSRESEVRVSYDPISPEYIDGLYYPCAGISFIVGNSSECPTEHRLLGVRRFANADMLRAVRREVRGTVAVREELAERAEQSLIEAAGYHFKLEKIYCSAMDFEAKGAFEEEFCKKLFEK